ncbi:MAG TPA: subclass B1 metallo-beta-lactamase [Clostridia bacterium]|nr:subclass B1 metallo-beta-lactamase [Clostridia bacterium]
MKKIGLLVLILSLLAGAVACSNSNKTSNAAGDSAGTIEKTNETASPADNSAGTAATAAAKTEAVTEQYYDNGLTGENRVELHKINDRLWVHITYAVSTPSNGLLAVTSEGLVLIDTPWTNRQTKELLKLAKEVFKQDVTVAVITHAHSDRIGGIDTLLENGIDARCIELTAKEAEKNGFTRPETIIDPETDFSVGDVDIEAYYPGKGHSPDNITVWFPQYKVLFGGCLLKPMEAKDRGSITDADTLEWPVSIGRLQDKYPEAGIVIPGHGKWGGPDILKRTLDLVS